ncbi:MAG: hypothetical protein Q7J64_03480 [Elusimicrobiota bacterium]|nr:hypothetical protein [Elusimicrobiota bacterium]
MKNGKPVLFCVLALQIAAAYRAIPSRATTLADRMHAMASEVGMATMGNASQLPTPAVVSSKESGATRSVVGRAVPVEFGLMSVDAGVKINKTIFGAAASKTASSPLTDTADETYFKQLEKLYAQGMLPLKENLTGWFAGRCYKYDSPGSPKGGLLVGLRHTVGGDNGPLFPPKSDFRILSIDSFLGADLFDDITMGEESELSSIVNSGFNSVTAAVAIDGALASKHMAGNLEYRIRKHGSFFIESAIALGDSESLKAGDTYAMCYYFKKVR